MSRTSLSSDLTGPPAEGACRGDSTVVVVPVEWGDLSKNTFLCSVDNFHSANHYKLSYFLPLSVDNLHSANHYNLSFFLPLSVDNLHSASDHNISYFFPSGYVDNLHSANHCVHICHVPDFRRHLQHGMSPQTILGIMIETNAVSSQLKQVYEALLAEEKVQGKFVRVGGNNRWSAIVDYCKLVDAKLIVLGSQPKPGPFEQQQQKGQPKQQQSNPKNIVIKECECRRNSGQADLQDMGPALDTVTYDVMQHCDISTVVYRQSLSSGYTRTAAASQSRKSSFKRKSIQR
ncbi:hypothetical protein PoB_007046300 [Plakobranchus ocellatus]|uniref:Uncharacterized protein n=1 Tax=Plakobranchus ocellatus TaxID=259542 RepID=A0AAV4DIT8_9GAST|nr:hypothetical protein PoB_007046300 [Plakobranchus ocellatus]